MLCWLLLCSELNHLYGYIYPLILDFLPVEVTTEHWESSLRYTVGSHYGKNLNESVSIDDSLLWPTWCWHLSYRSRSFYPCHGLKPGCWLSGIEALVWETLPQHNKAELVDWVCGKCLGFTWGIWFIIQLGVLVTSWIVLWGKSHGK